MQDWVAESKRLRRKEFSELDVLLRVLDRGFNPDNHPITDRNYRTRDFYPELSAIRDVILRLLSILESLIPESRKNAFWFQKFAEQKFLTDRRRDIFRESLYKQDTEEKSIFLLYDSFVNLKVIIHDILRGESVSYDAFKNFGELIIREIRENRFLDPFKKEFHPEFDKIENDMVSSIVKSIKQRERKRAVSIILIYLFRVLRFLSHVDSSSHLPVVLNTAYMILVLIKSEIRDLISYIDDLRKSGFDGKVGGAVESLSFQITMESKRVYDQELKDLLKKTNPGVVRGRIENSYGILKNTAEQSILLISQAIKPGIKEEDLFPGIETRYEQSVRLLEDVTALSWFFKIFEENFNNLELREALFASLRGYMLYFQSFTFRLLRYEDYEEFARFFEDFLGGSPEMVIKGKQPKLLEKCRRFRIYLDTTLNLISKRAELGGRGVDEEDIIDILKQFLPEGFD
ncbi:MAG: hypothetical protein D6726_09030, partial [Nitrospirae bacterium]